MSNDLARVADRLSERNARYRTTGPKLDIEKEWKKGFSTLTNAYLSMSVSTYLTNVSFWILSAICPTFSRLGTSMNAT